MGGKAQFNLRSGAIAAPHIQLCPNLFRSFAHAGEAPVSRAISLAENDGIDTNSIVADAHAQFIRLVIQFRFDRLCIGVPKRVPECFSSNSGYFVEDDRMERARASIDDEPEVAAPLLLHPAALFG